MGFPCDEIIKNHSKGLSGRFFTLWAKSGRWLPENKSVPFSWNHTVPGSITRALGSWAHLTLAVEKGDQFEWSPELENPPPPLLLHPA